MKTAALIVGIPAFFWFGYLTGWQEAFALFLILWAVNLDNESRKKP